MNYADMQREIERRKEDAVPDQRERARAMVRECIPGFVELTEAVRARFTLSDVSPVFLDIPKHGYTRGLDPANRPGFWNEPYDRNANGWGAPLVERPTSRKP